MAMPEKALKAAAEAEGLVARDEDVATTRRFLAFLAVGDAERLQIGAVGKEDATVFRAERVAGVPGDGEAERGQALAGHPEVGHRQHQMVDRAGRSRTHGHGEKSGVFQAPRALPAFGAQCKRQHGPPRLAGTFPPPGHCRCAPRTGARPFRDPATSPASATCMKPALSGPVRRALRCARGKGRHAPTTTSSSSAPGFPGR
jgi:hypothetical protein